MPANYDRTTWFYERLSKLVFGEAQIEAQNHFLNHVQLGDHVLIIGGGTGQILEELTRLYPALLHITYVEASTNMMALSHKRNTGNNEVTYIQQSIEDVIFDRPFDVVLTAFLFDNFSEESLKKTFPYIDAQLKPGGLWLDTDFQLTGPLWQKVMLKSMYLFFKLMKAVEVMQLPDTARVFQEFNYVLLEKAGFYRNFIGSAVYKKPELNPPLERGI